MSLIHFVILKVASPSSPLAGRRRTSGSSQGSSQKVNKPERLTAAQQLNTTVPPPVIVKNL